MKILLVSATQLEVQTYLLTAPHHDILITGVGVAAATYELTNQLNHHHYDLVVQAGVAGMFATAPYKLGDVVLVKQDAFGDAGSYEQGGFQSLQTMGLTLEKEWLTNNHALLGRIELPQVKAITINTITDNTAYLQALSNKWGADIESMEGAALHYVCSKKKVPFLQIRSISNVAGVRDKNQWQLATAITNLNHALGAIVAALRKS